MEKPNGNGDRRKLIAVLVSVVSALLVALSSAAWARIENIDGRLKNAEKSTYQSEILREEILRRLDRIEEKIDRNGGKK